MRLPHHGEALWVSRVGQQSLPRASRPAADGRWRRRNTALLSAHALSVPRKHSAAWPHTHMTRALGVLYPSLQFQHNDWPLGNRCGDNRGWSGRALAALPAARCPDKGAVTAGHACCRASRH